jgi:hypothetical protein
VWVLSPPEESHTNLTSPPPTLHAPPHLLSSPSSKRREGACTRECKTQAGCVRRGETRNASGSLKVYREPPFSAVCADDAGAEMVAGLSGCAWGSIEH